MSKKQSTNLKHQTKLSVKSSSVLIHKKETVLSHWKWIAAILLLTFISFYPSLRCGFTTWDDPLYVTESTLIKSLSFENISNIFSIKNSVALNYHPITVITLAIDYHFAKLNAAHYHFSNLFIHLLNTLFVFLFAYRLSERKLMVGIFVSVFFGIHPMHVESVAWISERKDVLYTFFFLGGLLFYLKYNDGSKTKYLIFSFLLFLFAVLSKAVAVIFPILLLLIDYYKGRKITTKVVLEKIPFILISLIFGLVAVKVQAQGAIASYETFSLLKRISFGLYGYFNYCYKFLLPFHLSSFYPYPILDGAVIAYPFEYYFSVSIAFLVLVGGIILLFSKKQNAKLLAFGLGFFFITIVLVLQFISVGQVIMADRYSYVPYIGLLFLLAMLLYKLFEKKPSYKFGISSILVAVALFFSYLTYNRISVWESTETLWTDVINKYPFPPWKVEIAYTARGKYYAAETKELDKALADFNVLLEMKTKNQFVFNNLASVYGIKAMDAQKSGNQIMADEFYSKSINYFGTSLSIDSTNPGTYANRATAYIYIKQYELAAADYNKAAYYDPSNIDLIEKRAFAYIKCAKWEEAIADYNKLMATDTSKTYMYQYRGKALQKTGRYDESINDFIHLARREPQNAYAYYNLATNYFRLNELEAATSNLLTARNLGYTLDPDNIEFLKNQIKKNK